MIFVNFKTYKEGTGGRALELVKVLRECERDSGVPIIPVVQTEDAVACIGSPGGEVWVQHTDSPGLITKMGVKGAFLNHSDNKIRSNDELRGLVEKCKEVGLRTLVFAADLGELRQVLTLKPDFVAYEPPELIASKETSVAHAKPEIVKKAAVLAKSVSIPLIIGAGIKDSFDVKKSLELGAVGVAVSSAVVLAEDPKKVVLELAKGFK